MGKRSDPVFISDVTCFWMYTIDCILILHLVCKV